MRIVAIVALLVAAMVAVVLALADLPAAIRWTARSSFVLFVPTFVASSLNSLRPGPATKWLLRNRRWLGLSFAVSHVTHLGLIIAAAPPVSIVTVIGGGGAYLVLAAMVLTSTDAAQKRLGRRRWRALHLVGMYLLFAIFLQSYLGRAVANPAWLPFPVVLLAAWGLRVAAWRRRVSRSPTAVRDSYTRKAG